MIRNNCIQTVHEQNMYWKLSLFVIFKTLYSYHGKFIDIVSPSGVYAITVTMSAYHSRRCGRL
jgi:hypothetical protein